jgi:hypothetical protein
LNQERRSLVQRLNLAIGLAALLSSTGAFAQDKTPSAAETVEDLGRGIFAALQAGSFEAMEHLLPSEQDFLEIIKMQAEHAPDFPEERIQEMRAEVPQIQKATRDKLATEFANVREPWREIDWNSAAVTRVRITVRNPETYEEREVDDATLAAEGLPAADVQILFQAGDRIREIDLQDCAKTSRGWLVMEALSLPQ